MNIQRRYLKILTIAILIGLVVFSVLALVLRIFLPGFDPTSYITAIAILAIAVMAVVYQITTSGQLEIMREQLCEMKQTRKLGVQPLPILTISKILIEPPRFFYNPSKDLHSFNARLRVNFYLKNHTSYPAINVIASAVIMLNDSKKPTIIRCSPTQLDILAENEIYPAEGVRHPDFLLCTEKDDEVLVRLQKKTSSQLPILPVHLIYTNILGACFVVDVTFQLVLLKQEDEGILKKWHSLMVSFPVEYKEKLKEMELLKTDNKNTEWKKRFNLVEKKLIEAAGKDDLELSWNRLPNSFQVRTISSEEYKEELKHTGFEDSIPQ